ncbi:hypothetical protein ABVK25_001396 [Lepraria finkii]|uniref:Uncharacterized protein n=1 Tax=Lepraria finkii TaxID=1340010 RepID=A0ABR4BPE6_9LECA
MERCPGRETIVSEQGFPSAVTWVSCEQNLKISEIEISSCKFDSLNTTHGVGFVAETLGISDVAPFLPALLRPGTSGKDFVPRSTFKVSSNVLIDSPFQP